jgi:hypothetical protein
MAEVFGIAASPLLLRSLQTLIRAVFQSFQPDYRVISLELIKIISPRVVHFLSEELIQECNYLNLRQCGFCHQKIGKCSKVKYLWSFERGGDELAKR